MTIDSGSPMNGVMRGAWKVPSPLPSMTAPMTLPTEAVTRSSLPSPLTSPAATGMRNMSGANVAATYAGWNVPSPLPSKIVTLLL